ncbi:FtsW/RodA/SpoVE family cell cycle protein [Kovacikia minuta CCNUW1]|uniref:FtsW/RodA/SpoVE family cell cycle protein n=1 Tax=Kovacikia minuta TaxID=2931930 RepID=UPI001CCA4A9D|nr:FtsW/RodA/SpoVE family cell cycle protein [Kovacikia minuta]UBF25185.1 FtsW/RodA/SpoVE family cell cycle protein [Kovacikia minuta CCNUW1]
MNIRLLIPFFDTSAQDWSFEARWLRWLTFLWMMIGLAIMFSASYVSGESEVSDGLYFFKLQIAWILVGMVGFNLIVHSPLRYIVGVADWVLLLLLGLLLITLMPGIGKTVNGATRWLSIGPVPIQPSELIKPFLVLQSARIFGQWNRLRWSTRLAWLAIFCLVLVGILLQPNLSTTALCGIVLWMIALAAGLPFSQLGGTAVAGFLLAFVSVSIRSYQRRRVMSFLNPWADPMGDGYQLIQSLLAVGSGGMWGTGFGMSQQKLFHLPIQFTDFIFSVYAEEFGLVGCLLLLSMLIAYATLALRVALKTRHPVYRLVAIGIMVLMVGQSLLNIGVATGALPTTGLPFPLISYGGSSMISSLLAAGLLLRVAREGSEAKVLPITGHNS